MRIIPEPPYRSAGASFSPDRTYRYLLWRKWGYFPNPGDKGIVLFIMLNPSTADERVLDPTVRKCLGFAQSWGYTRMDIVNIFALRSTDPKKLYSAPDPIGPENDIHLSAAAKSTSLIIAAWGNHGQHLNRAEKVIEIVTGIQDLYCLGITKEGNPGHPLYLPKDCKPQLFRKKRS